MGWDQNLKGANEADIINGGSGDDFIQGKAGDDTIDGGDGDDALHGDSGDDHLRGGSGDDLIHGGTGFDTAYYSGSVFDYSYSRDGEIFYLNHVGGSMIDGNDRLLHVERLVFADAVIELGIDNAPIAFDDVAATHEDVGTYSSGSASVLDNDFDWEGDALSVTAGTFTGTYGTLVLNSDGTYTYTPYASAQSLAQGQIVQDVFTYTVTDGNSSDSGTLTINLAGVNDAPTANPDSATTSENAVVAIDVLANDADVDNGAALTVTAASSPAGQGTASVVSNQVQWDPGTDFDHLAVGASEVVVIDYTITDEFGATSSSTVSITVTGTNDGPVATPDSASTGENTAVLVDVLANDSDVDDGAVLTVTAASAPSGQGIASIVGNQVQFDPGSDFDHLADGDSAIVVISYTIQDEHGASASSTVTITVTGTNDGPVANPDVAATSENAVVTVDVLANDTDADDGAVLTVTAASSPAGQGTASVVGNQVQFDPGADFDYLAVGETAQVVVSYDIEDEHGATSNSTVTITVNGANDAPTIDSGGTTATGSVAELPNGDPGEGTTMHEADGTIAFDDLDLSDTHSATATAQGSGYYGTFTLDAVDQSGNSVGWNFDVSDAEIDGLAEGEVVTQIYTITISDGNGGTTTQDVSVTITGAADSVAPDGINWYIDNSAVGSANTGSPSDPFTSLAAFNAAQGTAGGPDAGDNIFLLAGTGIYAESDGINLLDGQVLTGVASGSVRPTIHATAGDGINVAQNNSVSGIDIGDTSGAGIADSGGSVGTLIVTDVGVSGTGQIVDIDEGGTISVTLNSAASTASSGGAIDLAGVGGSFTITGSMTIVGASGGGVNVVGTSLAVNLTGGGLVSSGGSIAINFLGNSGSLALGGGLDIVTTGGAGLVASGGGTVTFTGAGNSITTAAGTAVTISGTTIGAAGVTLESVSTTGAVNAIVLSGTGSLGGFAVTGTGIAGSGGTISGSTGTAILVSDTMDLNLAWMAITNSAGNVLSATDLRGDSGMTDSVINGFGTAGGFTANAIAIVNNNVDLDSFTLADTAISGGATANDGLFMEAQGSSNMRLLVDGATFSGLFGDGIQVNGTLGSTGQINVTIENSSFVNAAVSGNGGVSLNSFGGGTMRALVEGNIFDDVMRPNSNLGAINLSNGGTATAHFMIIDNVIEDLPGARGISFVAGGSSDNYVMIDGNSIDRLGITSKIAINVGLIGNATGDVIISDNLIGQNGNLWTAGTGNANAVSVLAQNAATMDLLIDGNAVTANTGFEAVRVRSINTAVMNATVSDNVLLDTAGGHLEFDATAGTSVGSAVLNLNIFSNDLPDAGLGVIRLNDLAGGVLNVTQSSAADVSLLNDMATVTVLGTVFFGAPPPPLPVVPEFPM